MTNRRAVVSAALLLPLLHDQVFAASSTPAAQGADAPQLELVLEVIADVADAEDLGDGPLGRRRIVPIIGGSFEGRGMRGKVRAGGADRQLVRSDGVKHLSALYELEAEDGAVITVLNEVLVEDYPNGGRYAFSTPKLTAPKGPHDWINHCVFVGTLTSLRPERKAVKLRFYRVH